MVRALVHAAVACSAGDLALAVYAGDPVAVPLSQLSEFQNIRTLEREDQFESHRSLSFILLRDEDDDSSEKGVLFRSGAQSRAGTEPLMRFARSTGGRW